MLLLKESTSSKASNEDGKVNYRNDSIIQCSSAAADEWRKERREEWKDDKCRREADGEREDEKNCWEEIFEEERAKERKERGKKRERGLREDGKEENRWINLFSLFDVYINRF